MKLRLVRAVLADIILFPIFLFCIWNAGLVMYGLRMGKGQMQIIIDARPVTEVLADASIADSVKVKLKLIQEIRAFAFDSIGLKRNENYTTFYDQKGQRLIYVVTACDPFALKPYQWHFPVLGDVPYKGFFDKDKAVLEEKKMKLTGYDTDIGGASGWSTLGWFKDPILSNMLANQEGELAELIIHELTHGTIFVKNNVEYNENLASFIGYKGAIWFLESKYGKDSDELKNYLADRKDEKTLIDFMLRSAHSLDSLYKQFSVNTDIVGKQEAKEKIFHRFAMESKTLPLEMDSLFSNRFEHRLNKSGNTFFMQYMRYEAKQTDFEGEYEKFGNLRKYMSWLKEKY
jgi:predicted aminopeptidase